MAKTIPDALACLRTDPGALDRLLAEGMAAHGRRWAFDLVLKLEADDHAEDSHPSRPELKTTPPLWVTALLRAVALQAPARPIADLEIDLCFHALAQAIAPWLGFTQGRPATELLDDWLGDTSPRSAVQGPLLLPFLADATARELCLEAIGERSDEEQTVALSARWFVPPTAAQVTEIAAQLTQAKAKTAQLWSRVLAGAMATSSDAGERLLAFALSGDKRAHQIAREILQEHPTQTLAMLEQRALSGRRERSLAQALIDFCRAPAPALSARAVRAAEAQRLREQRQHQVAERRRLAEEARQAAREEKAAQQAERRAAFAAQDRARVDALVAAHGDWVGRRHLSGAQLRELRFDLGRLLRCGWFKRDSEESHKFLYYLARRIGDAESELRLCGDIYWDELPRDGIALESVSLPEPFGRRSPVMDRMLGELFAAHISRPRPPRSRS